MSRLVLLVAAIAIVGCHAEDEPAPDDGIVIDFDEASIDQLFEADRLIRVDIEMAPEDFDALRNQTRTFTSMFAGEDCRDEPFPKPYTFFEAAISIDGESLPRVGIRKKGFIGSQSSSKPGFRINLDEYVDGARLFGTDNITLNNGVQDPALIRQCLSYKVFHDAGHPSPRCSFAEVTLNGEPLGAYVHVEPVKRTFLRQHFPTDDGDLYEGTVSDFVPGWENTFEPKNFDTDSQLTAIRDITARLADDEDAAEVLAEHFDVDSMLTHFALEAIIGHWDGYVGNRNNFYIYRDPVTDLFSFIPWGTDGTFRSGRVDEPFVGNGILGSAVLQDPELRERFDARVRELLDEHFVAAELHAEVDRMVALLGERDEVSAQAIEDVRRFIDRRPDVLRNSEPVAVDPQPPFCMIEQGTIGANFETTWGSIDDGPDLTQVGTVELEIMTDDGPVVPVRAGVVAGLSEGRDPILAIIALIDPPTGTILIWYIGTDPDVVRIGEPITIGAFGSAPDAGLRTEGGVLFTNNETQQLIPAGFMQGELTFTAFGAEDGAEVRGTLSSVVLNWGEVEP